MAIPQQQLHMTPGLTDDCYLPGCTGVLGGICAGLTSGAVNETLWWCCTPYEPNCRGGAQLACEFKDNGTELVSSQISCSLGGDYHWCCSNANESCPPLTGLASSCIPKTFPNPAANGPVWGPSSSSPTNVTSAPTSTTLSLSGPSTDSPTGTSMDSPTGPSTNSPTGPVLTPLPTNSSKISLGGAAALGAGGVLVLVAVVGGVFYLWRRNSRKRLSGHVGPQLSPVEMQSDYGALAPQEIQGESVHELETGEVMKRK